MTAYSPRKGDFIAVTFDPQSGGHEQRGRRPALVVSHDLFNKATGFCIACPVTNTRRGYPFHVSIPDGLEVTGVVMVEQVKSIDWNSRGVKRIGTAPEQLLQEVLSILDACIY
jgi:mRNA interferase MazF